MSLTSTTLGRGRRVAAGSLIAVAALGLTACQSGTDSASHSSSASASATAHSQDSGHGSQSSGNGMRPSGSQSRSAAAGPSSQAGGKSASGKPGPHAPGAAQSHTSATTASDRCTADNMSLHLGRLDIGAGNIHIPLVFTNKGKTACSLRGFPGVSLIQRDGSTVGKPATRSGGAGGSVRLQPGQSAHAVLHTVNEGVSDTPCWSKSQLVFVYPPGSKNSMTTGSGGLRVCGGQFDVTSVQPGSLG
ncbi:DUF4232 domain-containing protein [Streptomyces natalensis]|uniref:Serine/threonine protein kinase n=1 Tax=Streptomyces natalensis ATCC 27448 TaxID=1240678 RepID=A0A0D7CKI1_9ACTN|nr:DUF4232 domain-containing protein [Streptomyces natalensis]KIZ16714.1 serine/threonine protein kinase [Streptomyces natalensis ATCC 27448]